MKRNKYIHFLMTSCIFLNFIIHATYVFAEERSMSMTYDYSDETVSYQVSYNEKSDKGTVLFLHGLGDHKTTHQKYIDQLVKAGFRVIAPDAYSHGSAPGSGSTIIENIIVSKNMIDTIIEREHLTETDLYLYGYSMGGMTAYYYAANGKYPAKGIVSLISTPDFSSVKGIPLFYERYKEKVKTGDVEKTLVDAMLDAANPLFTLQNEQIPIYIDNGSEDLYMPIDHVRKAVATLQNPTYKERQAAHSIGESEFIAGIQWLSALASSIPYHDN